MKRYVKSTSTASTSLNDEIGQQIVDQVAEPLSAKYGSDVNVVNLIYDEETSTLIVETPKGETTYNLKIEYVPILELINDETSVIGESSGKRGDIDKFIRDAAYTIYYEN